MALAGGRVRGVTSKQQCEYLKRFDATVDLGVLQEQERARAAARLGMGEAEAAVSHRRDNVWPLQLVDIGDEEQREVLFGLLAKLPDGEGRRGGARVVEPGEPPLARPVGRIHWKTRITAGSRRASIGISGAVDRHQTLAAICADAEFGHGCTRVTE